MRYTVEDLADSINKEMNSDDHSERYMGLSLLKDTLNVFCNPAFVGLLDGYPLAWIPALKERKRDELIENKKRVNKSNCWIMKQGVLTLYNNLTKRNEKI